MPKMKRHKGLAKRMRVTARGKLRFNKSCAGHLMSAKESARRRRARKQICLSNPKLAARIKRYLLA